MAEAANLTGKCLKVHGIPKQWRKPYYRINCGVIQEFPALGKAGTTHVKKYRIFFFTCVDIANQLLTRHTPLAPLGQFDE